MLQVCQCLVAISLGIAVLAAGCGGGGDDVPRVTLTDTSCTYSGARTHEPGVLEIEAENMTSHFASFAANELAPGYSIDDVRQFYARVNAVLDGREASWELHPDPGELYGRGHAASAANPQATTVIPLNELSGRFVILCAEEASSDTRQSFQDGLPPEAYYVAGEIEFRSKG